MGSSLWDRKESNLTERRTISLFMGVLKMFDAYQ